MEPGAKASINSVGKDDLKLGSLMRATCRGIIDNLLSMLPLTTLKSKGVSSVVLAGGAFEKNPILVEEAKRVFEGMDTRKSESWRDAAYGAALFALDHEG